MNYQITDNRQPCAACYHVAKAREEGTAAAYLIMLSRWALADMGPVAGAAYDHMSYLCGRDAAHAANMIRKEGS